MSDGNVTPPTGSRAATLTEEQVDRLVYVVFSAKWPQTPEPRSEPLRDLCRKLVRHAYDTGYQAGWTEGLDDERI